MARKKQESIDQFKQFVKKHPGLVKEVREKRKTWKDLYEDWFILGEEDAMWEQYKKNGNETDTNQGEDSKAPKGQKGTNEFIGQMMDTMKKMDMDELQRHIANVSGAISNIQQLLEQFQSNKEPNQPMNGPGPGNPRPPFYFNKD